MNYKPFYQYCKSVKLDNSTDRLDAFIEKLGVVFSTPDFENIDLTHQLFLGRTGGCSCGLFYPQKRLVVAFYEWLREKNLVSDEYLGIVKQITHLEIMNTEQVLSSYFKDCQSMLDYIDLVGEPYGLGGKRDMLFLKTICILSWYGLDRDEICEIRIADLNDRDFCIIVGDKKIQFKPDIFEYIRLYSISTEMASLPSGKIIKFHDTGYLLRGKCPQQYKANNISLLLGRFNRLSMGKTLQLWEIRRNGLFQRIYDSGKDNEAQKILIDEGYEEKQALRCVQLYKVWKEKYR